ncbi:MAG: DHHA2 domain-containing protein [Patescibacteria group bacterium]
MSKILITPKINPDLDGVACAYAYAKLLNSLNDGNEYIAGIFGTPHSEARFLINKFQIKEGLFFNPELAFDKFILVDASDLKGMPEIIRAQDVVEVIDHRATHQAPELFVNAKIQIELVGAAATLVWEKFTEALDLNSAVLLYGAIYSNTLNLNPSITTERDLKAVKDLEVNLPANLITDMFQYKTDYIASNLEEVMSGDFKTFDGGLGIAQLEGFNLDKLVNNNLESIQNILTSLKEKYNIKSIFLTAADINNGYNLFITIDEDTEKLLVESIALNFTNSIAKNNKLLLRKQILPLLINNLS